MGNPLGDLFTWYTPRGSNGAIMITCFSSSAVHPDRDVDAASAIDLTASKSHPLEGNIGDTCQVQGQI